MQRLEVSVAVRLIYRSLGVRGLTTNPEDEEIVDAPGNDGNSSMPEQVKRPNPWRKMMMNSVQ